MEEGLQGVLMGAVLVMFLIAMESALQVVDSSERWNRRWKSG